MRKYWYRRFLLVLLVLSVLGYAGYEITKRQEQGRKKEVSADTVSSDTVIPGGMPVGIYLETEGVMVLGTEKITGADGKITEPARHLVKAGDYIVECNGKKIADKKRLQDTLKNLDAEEVVLKLRRDSGYLDVKIKPVRNKKNQYMLGIWVRDNAQGLGTVTFLNTDSRFGALGHGIHDTDTNTLMEIKDGRVYETSIRSIQKGAGGEPGGIEGIIVYNRYNVLGTIDKNTDCGIFGTLERTDNLFRNTEPVGIMATDEIKKGDAVGQNTQPWDVGTLCATERMLNEVLRQNACLSLRQLAVNGHDMQALGLDGAAIGEMLSYLLDAVLDDESRNRRETLLRLARTEMEEKYGQHRE